jgi:hypothetical protein
MAYQQRIPQALTPRESQLGKRGQYPRLLAYNEYESDVVVMYRSEERQRSLESILKMSQLHLVIIALQYSNNIEPESMVPVMREDIVFCCCTY